MKLLALVGVLVAGCGHPAITPSAPPPAAIAVPVAAVAPDPAVRPWVGLGFAPDSTRVVQVVPGAPASRAGMEVGDELVSLDGVAVRSTEFARRIAASQPTASVIVIASRGGVEQRFTIKLAPRPDPDQLLQALLDKPAPTFAAPVLSGPYSGTLAELAGHVVVLDFWATWCRPCAITMPRVADWHARFAARGLRVVGISDEAPDVIQAFVAAHQLPYTIAHDETGQVTRDYLVQGIPMLVVIDKTGVVRHVGLGAEDLDAAEAVIVNLLQ